MTINQIDVFYNNIRYKYLLVMLVCFCVRSIGAYTFLPHAVDALIMGAIGVSGIFILAWGVLNRAVEIDIKQNVFLILFLVCIVVSALINIQYGVFQNIKILIWTIINFFVVYLCGKSESKKQKIKQIVVFQNIIIIFWLILTLISLVTFVLRIDYMQIVRPDTCVRIGYVENRLFGVFSNPNGTSCVSVFAIIFSFVQLKYHFDNSLDRRVNILNIATQLLYIVLANSRGTIMVLMFVCAIIVFAYLFNKLTMNKFLKIIICAVGCLAACTVLFYAIRYTRDAISYLINLVPRVENSVFIQDSKIDAKRMDFVDNHDISNLRFSIWLSSWEVFKTRWLFGTSPGNILTYAKAVLPDTFIARRKYNSSHSMWIGMPLYTGVCGAICIFLFFAQCAWNIFKYYIKKEAKYKNHIINMCFLIVFSMWVYGLVELEILFVNSVCSFVFWAFLGFANDYIKSGECKNPQNLSD